MVASQMHVRLVEKAVETNLQVCMLCKPIEVHRVGLHNMGNLNIFIEFSLKIFLTFKWSVRYFV